MELEELSAIYKDLIVTQNEHGDEELCFSSIENAKKFTNISLRNSHFFVSDEDRFLMQYLADIIRLAIDNGILLPSDLYLTEDEVIQKLNKDMKLSKIWKSYTELYAVSSSERKPDNEYCVKISAKKRYIDPLVLVDNNATRLTNVDINIRDQIQLFLDIDFDKWVYAYKGRI